MSSHQESFELPVRIEDAMTAVSASLGDLHDRGGWERPGPDSARMTAGESFKLLGFTNPVTVEIQLQAVSRGTLVEVSGSNTGWGPIQGSHVRGVVQGLVERSRRRVGTGDGRSGPGMPAAGAGTGGPGQSPEGWSSGGPGGRGAAAANPGPGGPGARLSPAERNPGPASGGPRPSTGGPGPSTGGPGAGRPVWGSDRIFVSYRRDDSGHATDRICERLFSHFGPEAVFKDIDDIPFGVNFKTHIESVVQRADVLLAVVGREWAGRVESGEGTRIDRPTDVVRIEIETSLARGIPVIPLFVNDALFPSGLPESLESLPFMNGLKIRQGHDFDADLERLTRQLETMLSPEEPA